MDLIVIEGEQGKGEYQFWNFIVNNYMRETQLLPLGGVRCLNNKLSIAARSNRYENILVLIDTTAAYGEVSAAIDVISEIAEYSISNIEMFNYYCFEDCLLLFEYIRQWVYSKEIRDNNQITVFNQFKVFDLLDNYIELGCDPIRNVLESKKWMQNRMLKEYVAKYVGVDGVRNVTKEQLAGWLLFDLTNKTCFISKKGHISACWVCDCKDKNRCIISNKLSRIPRENKARYRRKVQCGLWSNKKGIDDKVRVLFNRSKILHKFYNVGWLKIDRLRR